MMPPIIVNVFVTVLVTIEVSHVVRTIETCLFTGYRNEVRSGCSGHGIVIRRYLTSILLEELEMVDQEVGFGEGGRCVGDILATGFDAG
jgi:hypothetical protein